MQKTKNVQFFLKHKYFKIKNWPSILDFLSRDEQKSRWLDKCVEELKANEQWVLPALKQIKDICTLYQVGETISQCLGSEIEH